MYNFCSCNIKPCTVQNIIWKMFHCPWTVLQHVVIFTLMMLLTLCEMTGANFSDKNYKMREELFQEQSSDIDDSAIHECLSEGGSCSQSGQCCPGFTCSTSDSSVKSRSCVRDKRHEVSCRTNMECFNGAECIVDMTGQGFCQVRADSDTHRAKEWSQHMYAESKGGLGAACELNSHCKSFTLDGKDELCCQDVHRGRYGTKRMCDRVTRISKCITEE